VKLDELLAEAAGGLPGTAVSGGDDGSTTWSRGGRAYAAVSADRSTASFCLDPAVAAAAIRTPDTTASGRGPGWVDFRPDDLDDHAADRAVAWLGSAYRRLAPRD
jgi:hypothetical protein